MSPSPLAPAILVAEGDALGRLVRELAAHAIVAVDTESNSLHAYRERVCLIQFSTPAADYIVDPIGLPDLNPLAPFFANPDQQKVFHAAEYDIICLRRDYGFEFTNIFDTMSAARTLGWPQVGLANILETRFGVKMNKKYQRADWKRRPLTAEQLDYARLDTHYLVALREILLQALTESGRWPEAEEEFARLTRLRADPDAATPDPAAFWRVKGARDLTPAQAAILQALFSYREQQAERLDRPPFKVMGEATLMELARRAPQRAEELQSVPGMTPEQIHRYGHGVLDAIQQGLRAPPSARPRSIASRTKCESATTACTRGARTGQGRVVWSRMSSCREPRSGISPTARRAAATNWRASETSAPGGRKPTGRRFSRCSRAPQCRRAAETLSPR